jgi:hypothetical protein
MADLDLGLSIIAGAIFAIGVVALIVMVFP